MSFLTGCAIVPSLAAALPAPRFVPAVGLFFFRQMPLMEALQRPATGGGFSRGR
jgi:hypothetical protein